MKHSFLFFIKKTSLVFLISCICSSAMTASEKDSLKFDNRNSSIINIVDASRERIYIASPAFGHMEPTLFEGAFIPYKYFETRNKNLVIDVSFKIVLRMLNYRSSPIRTPSYMPSITAYSLLRINPDSSRLVGCFTFGHHSNGQDGAFNDPETGEVNLVNGNFSTNYVKIGLIKQTHAGNTISAAVEQHLNLDRCRELNGNYGFTRLHLDLQSADLNIKKVIKKLKKDQFIRLTINTTWITDKLNRTELFDASKRLISSLIISYRPGSVKNAAIFFQLFHGQDYYNIHYGNILSFARVGFNFSPSQIYKSHKA